MRISKPCVNEKIMKSTQSREEMLACEVSPRGWNLNSSTKNTRCTKKAEGEGPIKKPITQLTGDDSLTWTSNPPIKPCDLCNNSGLKGLTTQPSQRKVKIGKHWHVPRLNCPTSPRNTCNTPSPRPQQTSLNQHEDGDLTSIFMKTSENSATAYLKSVKTFSSH